MLKQILHRNLEAKSLLGGRLPLRGFLGVFKQEPIKFSTSKVLPYSQENFFRVVKDVQDYEKFIPWVTQSRLLSNTSEDRPNGEAKRGRFDGEVKIGFS